MAFSKPQISDFLRGDKEVVTAAVKHHGYALSHSSESLHHDLDLLRIVKSDEKRLKEFDKKWFKKQMKVLEILEEEAWMRANTPVSTIQYTKRKF